MATLLSIHPFLSFLSIMPDVEEQSLSQGGESDQSSQKTDQIVAFEVEQANAFELNPRPWYVV